MCDSFDASFVPDDRVGTSNVKAGWSSDRAPRVSLPPLMAKYKDRRINRYYMFSGSDIFADGTSRGQAKNVYEPGTNIINNWDCMEGVLDYIFIKLGLGDNDGGIGRPVVMTEPVANLDYARKSQLSRQPHGFSPLIRLQRCPRSSLSAIQHRKYHMVSIHYSHTSRMEAAMDW